MQNTRNPLRLSIFTNAFIFNGPYIHIFIKYCMNMNELLDGKKIKKFTVKYFFIVYMITVIYIYLGLFLSLLGENDEGIIHISPASSDQYQL